MFECMPWMLIKQQLITSLYDEAICFHLCWWRRGPSRSRSNRNGMERTGTHEIPMLGHLSIGLLIKLLSFCVERQQQPVNYIRKCPICFQSFTKFHVKNTFIAKISIDSIHWMGRHRFEPIIFVNTDLSLIDRFSISHVINAIHLFWLCLVFCFALVFSFTS